MIITTRDFGELEIDESEIITMVSPILGFENEEKFVLLVDDETDGMFSFLQSTTNSEVCFVLANPSLVFENYKPQLLKQTEKELGLNGQEPVFRAVTVIPDDFMQATVNLKSPIVICPVTKRAAQIILDDDYPLRAPLCETEA